MGARTLTVIRDAALLALSLALLAGGAGCTVQTVEGDDDELVGESESELLEGGEEDVDLHALEQEGSSDPSDRGHDVDPEPDPWDQGAEVKDDPGPDPEDPMSVSSKSATVK